ncbi:hypothetical protein, partial [Photobacterium proteolyticum]|uniref:hypothetical protein n=1 Tax=Photobacterium proteolyticum TaxID=1903952 RepID=UPI000AEEE2D9
ESVIGLNRNERSDNPGIRGRNTPEYALDVLDSAVCRFVDVFSGYCPFHIVFTFYGIDFLL